MTQFGLIMIGHLELDVLYDNLQTLYGRATAVRISGIVDKGVDGRYSRVGNFVSCPCFYDSNDQVSALAWCRSMDMDLGMMMFWDETVERPMNVWRSYDAFIAIWGDGGARGLSEALCEAEKLQQDTAEVFVRFAYRHLATLEN